VVKKKAIALYDYVAPYEHALTLKQDDVITVLEFTDAEWWKAEFNGKVGHVPANYVRLIDESVNRTSMTDLSITDTSNS